MKVGVSTGTFEPPHPVRLTKALLVYESDRSAFVTVHDARVKDGRAQVGAGTPATRPALAELARKLANATAIAGFIPGNLLYMSPRAIAWWRPAAPARVYFKQVVTEETKEERRIGTRNSVTPQPDLVFAVTARDWFVWAVDAQRARPDAKTQLFRAPHWNVWKDGRICTGNVKLPETMSPDVLQEYEHAFFGSNFTHPNDPQGLTLHPGGIYAMWRELLDNTYTAFPLAWLSPLKTKLGAVMKDLEASGGS